MGCCKNTLLLARLLARKRRLRWKLGVVTGRMRYSLLVFSALKFHSCKRVPEKRRRWWVRPIFENHEVYGAWFTLIPEMKATDHDRYYNFFRMWPEHFDEILEKIEPFITKHSWRKPICPGERLAITLRFLASGDSYMSLSYLFRVSDEAISRIIMETCHVIWRVLSPEVFDPPSIEMWLRVASEFESMWDFPHCVGAMDGLHVHIKAFPHAGTFYFNYKKRHSVSLMAVSDAKQRFLVVESGSCGSRGDGNIFARSELNRLLLGGLLNLPPPCPVEGMEGNIPFMFIGDAHTQGHSTFKLLFGVN